MKSIIGSILLEEDLKTILNLIVVNIECKIPKVRAGIFLFDSLEYTQKSDAIPSWSRPILNRKGESVGVFDLYYRTLKKPTQKELAFVLDLIEITSLALEREQSVIRKKLMEKEIQIQQANALKTLKHVSLSELAKNISHEVNSPLAVILGSVHQINRIIENEASSDKLKIYTARLNRSVMRIENIVKSLRSITREASNDSFSKVQVKEVIDVALSINLERFKSSNIKLTISGDQNVFFECRSTQISQALVNLLNNSYEAISQTENPWIEIHVENQGTGLRLSITDSGNGIPLPLVEKIMIPLFTTKLISKSFGLGLSVSQAIFQEHSGHLWYDKSCQHTRFVIELPIEQVQSLKQAA